MADRILTESPWNALFDNLPGIAQQVNTAMMQRKQQQLDQQNIDRQFEMQEDQMGFREDQFEESKRQSNRQFQLEAGKVLTEGRALDERADIMSTLLPNLAPELQGQKQAYLEDLARFESGDIEFGMRSKYPSIRQSAAQLYQFKAGEEQRRYAGEEAARKQIEMTASLVEGGILTDKEGRARIIAAAEEAGIEVGAIKVPAGEDEEIIGAGFEGFVKRILDWYKEQEEAPVLGKRGKSVVRALGFGEEGKSPILTEKGRKIFGIGKKDKTVRRAQ